MSKYWMTLYDRDDRQLAKFHVDGKAKIDILLQSWSLNHKNIEYVKLTVNPPDESNDETH